MKRKGCLAVCVAILLALVSGFTVFMPSVYGAVGDYDLSLPLSSHNETVDTPELLEKLLGEPLSDAEREYLARRTELKLHYNTAIPTRLITTEYTGERLTVSAIGYTYVAKDGSYVSWTPKSATLKGRTEPMLLSDETYTASFDGITEEDGLSLSVSYTSSFTLKKEDINSVLNKAYKDASLYKSEMERLNAEYLSLKEEYDKKLSVYEEYLTRVAEFELEYAKYTEYLTEKRLYDDAVAAYERYLSELESYGYALEEYNSYDDRLNKYNEDYAIYRRYLTELSGYETALKLYNEYLYKKETVSNQLSVLDVLKKSNGKITTYGAVMGPTVTKVLDNKKVLTDNSVGASPDTIDRAYEATNALRDLMPKYFAIKTEPEKYAFYCVHYEQFRDNIVKLLVSLDELYANKRVSAIIKAEDKNPQFISLLAFLSVIARGLTDGPVYNFNGVAFTDSYTFDGKTASAILKEQTYFTDTDNAAPLSDGYPSEVKEPIKPEEVKAPTKPDKVKEPTPPEKVESPGEAPKEVKEPLPVDEVAAPGAEPTPYVPETEIRNLVSAYEGGVLKQREDVSSDFVYIAECSVFKTVFGGSTTTVLFLSDEGEELYRTEVDKGSFADFVGDTPVRAEDVGATYSFIGWTENKGSDEIFDLKAVNSDGTVRLYPIFKKNIKSYKITFLVDGVKTETSFPYGTLPSYNGTPAKPSESDFDYVFSGWDTPICQVDGEKTYIATFEKKYLVPLAEGGAAITDTDGYLVADGIGIYSDALDIGALISRAVSLQKGIKLYTLKAQLSLSYSAVLELYGLSAAYIDARAVQVGTSGYRYRVDVYDSSFDPVEVKSRIDASFPNLLADPAHTELYRLDTSGERVYVRCDLAHDRAAFILNTGMDYYLACEYDINLIPSDVLSISLSKKTSAYGGYVTVKCEAPVGYRITRIYYLSSDGEECEITTDSFNMPRCDISVGAEYEKITYKVSFVSGGKTIATHTYYYGDTVVAPTDPTRPNSDRLYYVFKGWYPMITAVKEDAVYTAEFKAHLLPPPVKEGPGITADVVGLIVGAVVGVGIFAFAAVPAGIVFLLDRRKYKRLFKGRKTRKKE